MLVSGVLLGVLTGVAIRRTWVPLSRISVRFLPLLLIALGLRAVAPAVPSIGLSMYELAMVGTIAVAIANWRLPGAILILLGGVLNLLVVFSNGGMPVDVAALAAAGAGTPTDSLHVVAGDLTWARLLADVIPIPLFRSVYSVGDLSIVAGGFLIPVWAFLRR